MTHYTPLFRLARAALAALFCSAFVLPMVFLPAVALAKEGAASGERRPFDLPASDAISTLKEFAVQSGQQVIYSGDAVQGATTKAVKGKFTPRQALNKMLSGTDLFVTEDAENGALAITRLDPNVSRAAQETAQSDRPAGRNEGVLKLNTFEVMESKLLNMDKPRSINDPQPYVIFNRARIEQSGAVNIEDFLKQRLTMNSTAGTQQQAATGTAAPTSAINLRGLGTNQTLILIDGRRVANVVSSGFPNQPDLNGIPLAAVERIEVLPTTASGIYGGSATGGVINVVLRHDYNGVESRLTYENTFDTDSAIRRIDLNAGFNLEGGKTNILLAVSHSDQNGMVRGDRDFYRRGRATSFVNNPTPFLPPTQPPLGYTPNIRSATTVGGVLQNLTLKNGTALNSTFTSVPVGYAGAGSDNGAGLVSNAGRYNLDLANTRQTNGGALAPEFNGPTSESASLSLRRQFTPNLTVFLDGMASSVVKHTPANGASGTYTIPDSAPNNPFQQTIQVTVPFLAGGGEQQISAASRSKRLSAGVIVTLPKRWMAEADYTWNQSRSTLTFYPIGTDVTTGANLAAPFVTTGLIDVLRDVNVSHVDFSSFVGSGFFYSVDPYIGTLEDTTLRLSGPLGSLPAGEPVLSALVEHQNISLPSSSTFGNFGPGTLPINPERSQTIDSIYLEAHVPLVSARNRLPGIEGLELQVAARRDVYATHGVTDTILQPTAPVTRTTNKVRSTNPTAALRYQPVQDFALRVSYGKGFLPPTVNQIYPSPGTGGIVFDPRRGNTQAITPLPIIFGGNPNLKPEKSKSVSAGLIFTPRFLSGLRVSIDYTKITKTDNIFGLGSQQLVDNESLFPGRVTRGPNLSTDPVGWAGPITFLDVTSVNIAQAKVEAYDVQIDYHLETHESGTFDFFGVATRQTHYKTQVLASLPLVENVGFGQSNPLKFKANAGLNWRLGHYTLGWAARYFDSYFVYSATSSVATVARLSASQGSKKVASQMYHDIFASYRFSPDAQRSSLTGQFLSGMEVTLGIKNVFNRKPPLDVNYDQYYSPYGDPRLASYYLTVKKTW